MTDIAIRVENLSKQYRTCLWADRSVAVLAAQHRLTLVTRDDHFDEIDTISTESW